MSEQHGDFITKLRQIEESALIAASEATGGFVKGYLRNIGLIARTLRSRLELGMAQVISVEPPRPASDSNKDRPG